MKNIVDTIVWFLKRYLIYITLGIVIVYESNDAGSMGFLGEGLAWPIKTTYNIIEASREKGLVNIFKTDKIVSRNTLTSNNLTENIFVVHVDVNIEPSIHLINLKSSEKTLLFKLPKEIHSSNVNARYMLALDELNQLIYVMEHYGREIFQLDYSGNLLNTFGFDFTLFRRLAVFNGRVFCNSGKQSLVSSNLDSISNEGFAEIDSQGTLIQDFYLGDHLNDVNSIIDINTMAGKFFDKDDPFHVNDIELVSGIESRSTETEGLNNGDFLISYRHLSAIVHVRKDSIINIYKGSWNLQHDVDVINDSIISISNNNSAGSYVNVSEIHSNVIHYNIRTGEEIVLYDDIGFSTETEGQVQYLPSGRVVIENQNQNEFIVVQNDSVIFRGGIVYEKDTAFYELLTWAPAFDYNPFDKPN